MGNSTWQFAVAGALALLAANVCAGQITLYEHPGLRGPNLTTTEALPNLERSAFNDSASSVVVADGTWEACTEPYFRGRCAQLAPGTYRQLSGELNGPVASVRPFGHDPGPVWVVIDPDALPAVVSATPPPVVINPGAAQVIINPAPATVVVNPEPRSVAVAPQVVAGVPAPTGSQVVLYRHNGRIVRAVELTSSVDDLDTRHFNDGADAALVTGGIWRLCDGEGGRGQCSDFPPGQYASLGALDGRVRSAYLIASGPGYVATVAAVPAGRAILYELPNFGGAEAVVEYGPAPDLAWAHFRNPASSLRIESGSWLVCTDLGYQGDCRVLEPGDYPVLAGTLGHGITSARQLWRPEYGSTGRIVARDGQHESHPDLSRYVP
jgi:hypothetical protein